MTERRVDVHRRERLAPRPLGLGRHVEVLELGRREAALDLGVALVTAVGEPACQRSPPRPVPHTNSLRPWRRAVDTWATPSRPASIAAIHGRVRGRVDLEEEVGGEMVVGRVGDVEVDRRPAPRPPATRSGTRCAPHRSPARAHGSCGPATTAAFVHQYIGTARVVRVADPQVRASSAARAVGQPQVDLEHHAADAFPLPQPEHRLAVGPVDPRRVQGVHRRGRVAARADVPLDATGEPGVAQRQVRRLLHRVDVQQLAAGPPVDQR